MGEQKKRSSPMLALPRRSDPFAVIRVGGPVPLCQSRPQMQRVLAISKAKIFSAIQLIVFRFKESEAKAGAAAGRDGGDDGKVS